NAARRARPRSSGVIAARRRTDSRSDRSVRRRTSLSRPRRSSPPARAAPAATVRGLGAIPTRPPLPPRAAPPRPSPPRTPPASSDRLRCSRVTLAEHDDDEAFAGGGGDGQAGPAAESVGGDDPPVFQVDLAVAAAVRLWERA